MSLLSDGLLAWQLRAKEYQEQMNNRKVEVKQRLRGKMITHLPEGDTVLCRFKLILGNRDCFFEKSCIG